MGLKDLYYSIEDKYYSLIEKTPLTKITDKIDSVVPSFAVLIALIILIAGFLVLPFFGGENYSFTVTIKDEQGKKLEGIKVNVFVEEIKEILTTDNEGVIKGKAKKDSEIKIEIDDQKYEFTEKQFTLTENKFNFEVELTKTDSGPTQANLKFTDKSGKYITGKEITVELSCQNNSVKPDSPATDSDKDGEITVSIPKGCGKIVVDSVEVKGYENWFGTINSSTETIKLNEILLDSALGDLKVIVENSDGELLDDIKVSLMEGNSKINQEYTVYGTAEFTGIKIGFYDLKIEDEKNEYEPKRIYSVEIENETINERTIEMQPTKKGTLKITVTDKQTNSRIKNAEVIIENTDNEIIADRDTGDTGSIIEFGLYSAEKLIITARAENYLPETIEINPETQKEIEIELEKITASNSGKLKIILVDEDDKNIANAKVMLKDEEGSLLTEYPEKFSNAKGIVEYSGIKEGTYFAYAEKYPASGSSDLFEIKLTEKTEVELKLIIGTAKIELQTKTRDGEPIPNTRVKVKSIDEEKTYTLDSEGKTTLEIKADKRVYFEFFDPENVYSSYTTKEYQLLPKNYFITAEMPEQNLGENLWIELKGVFFDETEQSVLVGGKKYKAVLELFIPENESYHEAGIHFRTGDNENPFIENDLVWIEKINASNSSKIKGTTWNPKTGQSIDFDLDNSASSNAPAKWINILWNDAEPGVYEAEIEIKIREGTGDTEKVSLSYRAWGKENNYYYFPADNELGTSSSTTTKQGLYAETFQKEFNTEEEIPVCMENNLCLSKQKLEDKTKEPFIIQKKLPFETASNGSYEYSFKIVNNSQSIYDEPELWIELNDAAGNLTEEAEITYYEIKTSEGNIKTKNTVNSNETQGISLGLYGRQSVIEGIIGIKTKSTGNAFVNLKIYEKINSGADKIFDNQKKTEIKIKSGKALEIEVLPDLIPAWSETPATIIIKDSDGIEVEQARVKLNVITEGNRKILIDEKETNRFGETEFLVPLLDPGTKIEFIAEKFEYETAVKEVILSEDVFVVLPETINETLSQRNNPKAIKEITIRNLLESELKIEKIELINETGYFEEFIKTGLMNAVFNSFKGQTIKAFPQEFNAELFNAELQAGLPDNYMSSAKGIMTIKLKNEEFNSSYSKDIEVELNLGQGESINNSSCLEIENGETNFSRQTTSQPVQLSYNIVNNCVDDSGKGIKLRNLKAKIEWTDKKGNVSLQMKARTAELKTTLFTEFSSVINEREEMLALLTYTPDPELTGETGQTAFNVIIEAEINTSNGIQAITTNPNLIKGKIGNVDLIECIEFDPKPNIGAVIESETEEGNFTIINNCGMEIELRFCENDSKCSGGTEGGITVKPNTTINSLKIKKGNNNAEQINITRTSIPGIYGITIEAKNAGQAWREITVYDVLVKPDTGHYFSLGDYTIKVPEQNNPDIIELYNENLFTNVDVDASDCDWQYAQEHTQWSKGILTGTGIGASIGVAAGMIIPGLGNVVGGVVGGVIGGIIGGVVCTFGGCSDPCDERTTETLGDYIINLSGKNTPDLIKNPRNLIDISLSINGIDLSWDLEQAGHKLDYGDYGKETLPLIFTKTTDEGNIKPSYGILIVNATKHDQKTKLNIPKDQGKDIIPFALPDRYSGDNPKHEVTELQEKFHVRAITKRYIEEIPPLQRSLDCVKPTGEIGAIGEQALPKIKLNWDWNEISLNECEQGNENYIYCDSAQFALMLNKRIHIIDEFMQKNNYSFSCPKNPIEEQINAQWETDSKQTIENGKIGIKEVQVVTDEITNKTRISAFIQNNTPATTAVDVEINLTIPEGVEYSGETSCIKPTGDISSASGKEVFCEFELPETDQQFHAEIKHINEETIDSLGETILESYDQHIFNIDFTLKQKSLCWAGTTTRINETELFPLNLYLNKFDPEFGKYVTQNEVRFNGNLIPTDDEEIINVIEEIKKLSHFNVYLMKDGFSSDFKKDFAEYYENKAFLEGATWFTDSDSETKNNELAEYYKQGLISFNRKYLNAEQFELTEPGLYRVDLSIDYTGDEWNLFNAEGNPKAEIKVEFTRLPSPTPNSIFYYLPFDGKIGEENFAYHRIGYGTGYTNLKENQLNINSNTVLSSSSQSSNPLNELLIEESDSLTEMNSQEETRGSILNLSYDGDLMQLKFYPSKATPVALKMNHEQTSTTEEEFSYFYGMQESNLPVTAGNRLAYWKGMGACKDFEGKFVNNYKQWDSKYLSETQNLYEVNWNNAIKGGTTYLKTIFYTPTERNIFLKVNPDTSIQQSKLFTPDESNSVLVSLKGISGMQFNNSNETSTSYLKNIQNVFDLIKEGKACISQNNISMNVYWNEAELFRTNGSIQSINGLEDSLTAGTNCIN